VNWEVSCDIITGKWETNCEGGEEYKEEINKKKLPPFLMTAFENRFIS
jgi:hypothetical protein